jgi:hypothetical protein
MMAVVNPIGTGQIDTAEGSGASMVILIAMVILFGAAAYFTGRLYGRNGMIAVIAGFVVVLVGLLALGGLHFGYETPAIVPGEAFAPRGP